MLKTAFQFLNREALIMAEYYLYTDESGKLGNSQFTAFCGFVTHETEWQRFSQEWANLRLAEGVPEIHMRCIMHPEYRGCGSWEDVRNKWGDMWERRRDLMLEKFANLIMNSHLVARGNAVDSCHFRSMPESKFKQTMDNPIYLSFYNVVRDTLDYLDFVFPRRRLSLALVLDDDKQYSMKCYDLLTAMAKQFPEEVGNRIDQICFGNDSGYAGLQAADMYSFVCGHQMIERKTGKENPHKGLYARLTRGGLHQPTLFTPDVLDKAAAEWRTG